MRRGSHPCLRTLPPRARYLRTEGERHPLEDGIRRHRLAILERTVLLGNVTQAWGGQDLPDGLLSLAPALPARRARWTASATRSAGPTGRARPSPPWRMPCWPTLCCGPPGLPLNCARRAGVSVVPASLDSQAARCADPLGATDPAGGARGDQRPADGAHAPCAWRGRTSRRNATATWSASTPSTLGNSRAWARSGSSRRAMRPASTAWRPSFRRSPRRRRSSSCAPTWSPATSTPDNGSGPC